MFILLLLLLGIGVWMIEGLSVYKQKRYWETSVFTGFLALAVGLSILRVLNASVPNLALLMNYVFGSFARLLEGIII